MNLSKTIKVNEATNEETRQEFGERIAMLLQQQKRSKAWLANKIGLSKQALNYLLNSSAKPKYVNEISAALEANPEWLRTGKGTFLILSNDDQGIRQIPLLNIEAIGKADQEKIKSLGTVTADQAYPSSCFAVKLENTSMEPTFNQGSILIFDPSKKPRSGDFVVFSVEASGQVFFRQYYSDGDDIYLKSVDTMYKNFKNEPITIHGVLIESRNQFK
jgi:SOS-response transcriptional repressor LexA